MGKKGNSVDKRYDSIQKMLKSHHVVNPVYDVEGVFVSQYGTRDILLNAVQAGRLDVVCRDNARLEELTAYLSLYNVLDFYNRGMIIGDAVAGGEPDLFSVDHKLGVEVVICGTPKDYNYCKEKTGALTRKEYTSKVPYYKVAKYDKKSEEEFFLAEFFGNLTSKLDKLNNGSYSACENRNLFVFANMLPKNAEPQQLFDIYADLSKNFDETFQRVFVSMNDQLIELNLKEKQPIIHKLPTIVQNDYCLVNERM